MHRKKIKVKPVPFYSLSAEAKFEVLENLLNLLDLRVCVIKDEHSTQYILKKEP